VATTSALSAQDQILDAAEALFARQGLSRTTIKEIGAAAGQNPALLYYYFGNKEALYRAVLERTVAPLISRGADILAHVANPADAIRALIGAQIEFFLAHPNAPKLFVREMIDHDARRAEAVILTVAAELFTRLRNVIEHGQREGVFRRDVESRFAAVSTISQAIYFAIARPAVGIFFGLGTAGVTDQTAREFARHAGEFAVRALSPLETAA
jgi:AcrR family transcriptional regulator